MQRGLTGDDERDWGMVAAAMAEIGEPSSAVNYYSSPGPKDGMGTGKGKRREKRKSQYIFLPLNVFLYLSLLLFFSTCKIFSIHFVQVLVCS